MTDSEINETIAELCGWKRSFSKAKNEHMWIGPGGWSWLKPMDYANDLNACTEFEKFKTRKELDDYVSEMCYMFGDGVDSEIARVATASSRERCEAFLRMHKKWNCDD